MSNSFTVLLKKNNEDKYNHQCETCLVVVNATPLNLSTNVFADIPLW